MAAETKKPTPTQEYALEQAVIGAYRKGWKGSLRSKPRPQVNVVTGRGWGRPKAAVTEPTLNALLAKGLVEQLVARGPYLLTKRAIEIGEQAYLTKHGVSAQAAADKERKAEADAKAQKDQEVAEVRKMFRGLKTARGPIEKEITSGGFSNNMRFEDIMELGKGIERLRVPPKG